ncbi:MAG: nucleotidyltransferase [Paenibacillaceae bacterium]|nr:nucleotidyltransferase [Paenibacillaceae bacterium]
MKETALVIMAAGIGSRFGGGIKQLEPVGPSGEIIMDYSIYDALEAGFNKIVFIIRKDLEKDFKEIIGNRIERIAPIEYAYQELDNLPNGFIKPDYRTKPWGTGHALLCAKDLIHDPFVVINADDYYGKEGFVKIHDYLVKQMNSTAGCLDICMAGFQLGNTLSENGGVTRGVCEIKKDGTLTRVTETYEIKGQTELATGKTENGISVEISLDQNVSMNMWGLSPAFIDELENGFPLFLSNIKGEDGKAEYLLPKIVDQLIRSGKAKVKVLETHDKWFGVTYKEDKPAVSSAVKKLVADGIYPDHLY